jgi:peptidyl-prolyl cis-trans isomerase D
MLKTMRNNFKSYAWTLWLVILAFVGGFVFFSSGIGGSSDNMPQHTVASIGNQSIADADFQKYLQRALEGYSRQFKGNLNRSFITQLQIPERALQDMLNNSIIQQECDRLGLSVSDKELAETICNDTRFQRDGEFIGTTEYENLLAMNQIRVKEFESELRQGLLADKLREVVTAGAIVDMSTLQDEYRKENDKADVETIVFKTDDVKDAITPNDEELRAYYQGHADKFRSEEARSGQAIVVKLNDFRGQLKIGDKELFDHYQAQKNQYRTPGKTKVSRIYLKYTPETREAILKKANDLLPTLNRDNFAQVAKDISEDDKAKEGGDWGYFAWRDFSGQEQTMIEKLAEMTASAPVDVSGAFSILMVTEKVAESQEAFADVKGRIRTMMESEQLRKLASDRLNKIYEQVKDAKDLKAAAVERKLTVVNVGPVGNGQAVPKVDDMGYISRRLFELQPGQVCQPVDMPDGLFIAQMQTIHPPRPQPFEVVRDRVRDEVVRVRKLDILQAKALAAAQQLRTLGDAKKIEEYLKKENLKTETAEYRHGDRLSSYSLKGLDDTVFALAANDYSAPIRFDTAVAIVKMKDKKLTSDADFTTNRLQIYEKKLAQEKESRFAAYIMERREDYKPKFNIDLIEKTKEYVLSRYH